MTLLVPIATGSVRGPIVIQDKAIEQTSAEQAGHTKSQLLSRGQSPKLGYMPSIASCILLLRSVAGMGQSIPFGSTVERHQYDSINLTNLQVTLTAPILDRGGPVADKAEYVGTFSMVKGLNATSWMPYAGLTPTLNTVGGTLKWGSSTSNIYCGSGTKEYATKLTRPYFIDVVGMSHPLPNTWHYYGPQWFGTPCVDPTSRAGFTTDASGLYVDYVADTVTDRSGYIYPTNGPSSKADPNGNTASATTTSLGQPFLTDIFYGYQYNDASWKPITITLTSTANLRLRTNCSCPASLGPSDLNDNVGTDTLVMRLTCPDSTSLGIAYEAAPNESSDYTGRISKLTLATRGTITYGYSGGTAPGPGMGLYCNTTIETGLALFGIVPTLTRTTSEGRWTYTTALHATANGTNDWSTTTVSSPSGNDVIHTFLGWKFSNTASNPIEVQTQTCQGGGTNCTNGCTSTNLLARYTYCYNNLTTFANCANSTASPANVPGHIIRR